MDEWVVGSLMEEWIEEGRLNGCCGGMMDDWMEG